MEWLRPGPCSCCGYDEPELKCATLERTKRQHDILATWSIRCPKCGLNMMSVTTRYVTMPNGGYKVSGIDGREKLIRKWNCTQSK